MAADKRGHRRHREHRAAGLARIQAMHLAGQIIACCLCGYRLDPFQPYDRGRNPWAPTLEHAQPLSSGGALFQPAGPGNWAHKLCQSKQGAELRNARAARTNNPSRNW